jgi:hypothetical protein
MEGMPPASDQVFVSLADVLDQLVDGDLLLWRRRGLISRFGRGHYSHAGMVAWWKWTPFCLEVRELVGGRAVTLASQVRRAPGRIDVFRANPSGVAWSRQMAVERMKHFAGCDYGYRAVLEAALLHLPFVRSLIPAEYEREAADHRPPFCSQAVAMAARAGGVDAVPRLADRLTEPSDLARSLFYRYRFTLEC